MRLIVDWIVWEYGKEKEMMRGPMDIAVDRWDSGIIESKREGGEILSVILWPSVALSLPLSLWPACSIGATSSAPVERKYRTIPAAVF